MYPANRLLELNAANLRACSRKCASEHSFRFRPSTSLVIVFTSCMVLGIGFYLEALHEDRRRLLPGRPRDDGLDRRTELSSPPTSARWN